MGFQIPKKNIVLKFADGAYDGLEIFLRPVTIKDALEAEAAQKSAEGMSEAEGAKLLFELIVGLIIDWNVEDDGKKVPITLDSLLEFPAALAWDIFAAFVEHTSGVSPELGKGSASTETIPVESIQMEAL